MYETKQVFWWLVSTPVDLLFIYLGATIAGRGRHFCPGPQWGAPPAFAGRDRNPFTFQLEPKVAKFAINQMWSGIY